MEQTVLLFFFLFFCSFIFFSPSESSTLSKSPPDFQLLSLVAAPDKQNLLDQADFTAAPAHMAASVAPLPELWAWGGGLPSLLLPSPSAVSVIHSCQNYLFFFTCSRRSHPKMEQICGGAEMFDTDSLIQTCCSCVSARVLEVNSCRSRSRS